MLDGAINGLYFAQWLSHFQGDGQNDITASSAVGKLPISA